MIRVANINEEGRYGGPQARIAIVAEKLIQKGIETLVVLPKENSTIFCRILEQRGIKRISLPLHRLGRDWRNLLYFFIFFLPELVQLVRVLRREKIDIVHCNGSWQVKGVLAGKIACRRVIWHLNDTSRPKIIKHFLKLVGKYFVDGFIFAGARVKEFYGSGNLLSNKFYLEIQAPVDTTFFDPEIVATDSAIADEKCLKIVLVGNINPAKGLECFIEMAGILNKKYGNLRFYIIGNFLDSQKGYTKRIFQLLKIHNIDDRLFIRQGVTDVRKLLAACDIYVCSSIHEASPMAVWEAMSMAKPIVSTDVGDVKRFIKSGENGFVVLARNAGALAEKVEILINDKHLRWEFGKRARETAIRHLDISICVNRHAEIYAQVDSNAN